MIIFSKWYGRLGNNIIQLSNLIDIAIAFRHNIRFDAKKHSLFDISVIQKYFDKYQNTDKITDPKDHFFYKQLLPFPEETFTQHAEERNQILREAFLIKDIKKLPENDLVVHIRSGDAFSVRKPHPRYVPPPLSYYVKQIDKFPYDTVHLVCEDKLNPVIDKLLTLYKNAVFRKNTLEEDIRLILGATNIVYSVGTFVPSLIQLSTNPIKYLHGSRFPDLEELKDYYKITLPWKNTAKQREYILTFNY